MSQTAADRRLATSFALPRKEVRETSDVLGDRALCMLLNSPDYYGLTRVGNLAVQALRYGFQTGRLATEQALQVRRMNLPQVFRMLNKVARAESGQHTTYSFLQAWQQVLPVA